MVKRHPVPGAAAAIMTDHMETLETEVAHHAELISGERAERIVGSIRQARRLGGVAVSAQVGADDGEALGQPRRDPRPHGAILRKAVQQQCRWSRSAHDAGDIDTVDADDLVLEALEHATFLPVCFDQEGQHSVQQGPGFCRGGYDPCLAGRKSLRSAATRRRARDGLWPANSG